VSEKKANHHVQGVEDQKRCVKQTEVY